MSSFSLAEQRKVFDHPREDGGYKGATCDDLRFDIKILRLLGGPIIAPKAQELYEPVFAELALNIHKRRQNVLFLTEEDVAQAEKGKLTEDTRKALIVALNDVLVDEEKKAG